MNRITALIFLFGFAVLTTSPAQAFTRHYWRVNSPDRYQTFAYGTENNRQWLDWRGHLALQISWTNDPFVSRAEGRQWDSYRFDFRNVRRDPNGRIFYYVASDGRHIPVAERHSGFLGIEDVRLLPSTLLIVDKPHGLVSVALVISDLPAPAQ